MKKINKIYALSLVAFLASCGGGNKAISAEKARLIAGTIVDTQISYDSVIPYDSFSFEYNNLYSNNATGYTGDEEGRNGDYKYSFHNKLEYNKKNNVFHVSFEDKYVRNGVEESSLEEVYFFIEYKKGTVSAYQLVNENGDKKYCVFDLSEDVESEEECIELTLNLTHDFLLNQLYYEFDYCDLAKAIKEGIYLEEALEEAKENYGYDVLSASFTSKGEGSLGVKTQIKFTDSSSNFFTSTHDRKMNVEYNNYLTTSVEMSDYTSTIGKVFEEDERYKDVREESTLTVSYFLKSSAKVKIPSLDGYTLVEGLYE